MPTCSDVLFTFPAGGGTPVSYEPYFPPLDDGICDWHIFIFSISAGSGLWCFESDPGVIQDSGTYGLPEDGLGFVLVNPAVGITGEADAPQHTVVITLRSFDILLNASVDPVGSGTVNSVGGFTFWRYPEGTSCFPLTDNTTDVTATPNTGYAFDHWTGDIPGDPETNYQFMTLDVTKSIVAHFVSTSPTYDLLTGVDPLGSGEVTLTPPGGSYEPDTVVGVEAVPAAEYDFDHWEGDLTGSVNPETLTMDEDKSVVAVFVSEPPQPIHPGSGGGECPRRRGH